MAGKISQMASASTLTGTELLETVQGGTNVQTTTQATANLYKGTRGTAIASAATVDLSTATGTNVHVTGNTGPITSFGTAAAGVERTVIFDSTPTITHNATSLILPGSANITATAGDSMRVISEGSGNWRCVSYSRASGQPLVAGNNTPNVQSVSSAATVTPTFSNDVVEVTAQAAGLTLANPTGTAVDGWGMAIRIKDNGTSRTISYGTQYRAIGVTLPSATTVSKTTYLGMIYNAGATKWDVVAVTTEA